VGRFAYSLDNGTVGVYHKSNRVWRVKSKHKCVALAALDLNADGITEVRPGPFFFLQAY
jgi:Bardet-Biedl syndrome 2 protein